MEGWGEAKKRTLDNTKWKKGSSMDFVIHWKHNAKIIRSIHVENGDKLGELWVPYEKLIWQEYLWRRLSTCHCDAFTYRCMGMGIILILLKDLGERTEPSMTLEQPDKG